MNPCFFAELPSCAVSGLGAVELWMQEDMPPKVSYSAKHRILPVSCGVGFILFPVPPLSTWRVRET